MNGGKWRCGEAVKSRFKGYSKDILNIKDKNINNEEVLNALKKIKLFTIVRWAYS